MNFEKTKLRNKLHFATLQSILFAAQTVKDHGGSVAYTSSEEIVKNVLRPQNIDRHENEEEHAVLLTSDDVDPDPDMDQCILEDTMYPRSKKRNKRANNFLQCSLIKLND